MKGFIWRLRLLRRNLSLQRAIDREVTEDAVSATVQRILRTAPVMAGGMFLAVLGFWLQDEPAGAIETLWREWIIKTDSLVGLLSLGFWLFARIVTKKKASRQMQTVLVYAVVSFVIAAGLIITLLDHLVMASITPFVLSAAIVGTFYYLPPTKGLVVFGFSCLVFCVVFSLSGIVSETVLSSTLVNGTTAHAMGFALSVINWYNFRRTKLQEKIIAKQQARLTQMAYHDSLTGLPNRRFLDELVAREVTLVNDNQTKSCLIMCDIDDFKRVNDTFGHPAGDKLLKDFADVLQGEMPGGTTIVRLGGEEFVILTPQTSLEEAMILAERLRRIVEKHEFIVAQTPLPITVSFGVAALRGTEGDRDYYSRADMALYEAKASGKNRVVTVDDRLAG